MIKRTLYFGNPAYLSLQQAQLKMRLPEVEKTIQEGFQGLSAEGAEKFKKEAAASIPIEDIGVVILDHQQIVITQALMGALLDSNVAIINCDKQHMPSGLFLPLAANTLQTERFKAQIEASQPLKKNLWQQTVSAKINNQAALLAYAGHEHENMLYWAESVKSGDTQNHEARAAAYYWSKLFSNKIPEFKRHREGEAPNNLLNYGYAILRAIVARGLVASGLLPTLGIYHRNKYNAYCLADDIMEPYRPFVDKVVYDIVMHHDDYEELSIELKKELLKIPTLDIFIDGERSPLMVGLQRSTASLARCFEGTQRKITYPQLKI
jgi:CRISPR-associated protein Cas1